MPKNKVRVVFDCLARFKRTSLNYHLLRGPDLTSDWQTKKVISFKLLLSVWRMCFTSLL